MRDSSDMELVRDYVRLNSEAAFAELVRRHIALVYSVALRHVGMAAHAEEITQAAFIILARKAASLRADTVLEGWLHETTRLTALSFLRGERRRQFREQEAYMQSTLQESDEASTWNQLAPLLDEAVSRLGKKDRDAVMLRFFREKSLREVAAALDVNETAAQRRVHRAVEKLRLFFTKRGIALSSMAITGAISANSVQAAPVALAKSVTAVAIAKGATASISTLTLIKGTLKIMSYAKLKLTAGIGVGVLLAGGVATLTLSGGTTGNLPPQEIIKKAREKYASLTSYNDAGKVVATVGGQITTPLAFTVKLARPNLYQIAWEQSQISFANKRAVWSAGDGDFILNANGDGKDKYNSTETALNMAAGISGGVSENIPSAFFKPGILDLFAASQDLTVGKTEPAGGVDCYVLSVKNPPNLTGHELTLWIGTTDFLIHQVGDIMSAEAARTVFDSEAKKHPENRAALEKAMPQTIRSIEIHTNIVLNQHFTKEDFDYPVPAALKPQAH